jgi:pimeloyl-ACP methyl ester carboxylesterase
MTPTSVQFVVTGFGRLAYRVDGEDGGIPLVLLQRFRGTMDDWDPAFVRALASTRRVIRFDSAGIGRSQGEAPDSIAGMARIAISFLKTLQLGTVDLLGWSLGGFIAQHVALDAPQLIRRLIIAGSGPGGVPEGPAPHPKVPEIATKPANEDEDFLFLFFTGTETGQSAGKASVERIKAVSDKGPPVTMASVIKQGKALGEWSGVRGRLANLQLPILVANGVHDVMIPAYGSYVISQEAPNAKLLLYPDAGHGFLFQYINEFIEEVDRFLKATRP